MKKDEVIEMEPTIDPLTGEEVWRAPHHLPALSNPQPGYSITPSGRFASDTTERAGEVTLPNDRFSGITGRPLPSIGGASDWGAAAGEMERGGEVVLTPDGRMVVVGGGSQQVPATSVTLTRDRFASSLGPSSTARLPHETATVQRLLASRVTWIKGLSHTTQTPGIPRGTPVGWLYRPRPNRYGDQVVCVMAYHPTTNLYHAHFWRYEANLDGSGRRAIDLPAFLGRAPHLTHHRAHIYTSAGSAVLCLSERAMGGLPKFDSALLQTMKWSDGTGEVVRGRPFPYR